MRVATGNEKPNDDTLCYYSCIDYTVIRMQLLKSTGSLLLYYAALYKTASSRSNYGGI